MTNPLIHLVFKTHLDIGFTDHAERVRRQYHDQFIPQAIATGEHFFAENPEQPAFIWTTGAWLIWDHLNSADAERVKRLERAIERGLIVWHGLPFTTHTELMSPALFRAGLSYAQELDQRFGKTTIAAKMTDVPGHTLGMVPLLAEAGIRFLHLGVNTASPVPEVPPIFRWRAPDGSEVVVMYQASYGATDFPAGRDIGLSFAHTNDNIGPQSVGQVVEAIRHLRHAQPDAEIRASTLDAFGAEMWARREQFPIVEQEIGDSWIHGAATDPNELARFRALQRMYDAFEVVTPERQAFGRGLTMVAEHTWGVDIKTYLRDETAWDRTAFEAARAVDYRFAYAEQSWAEQRGYLDAALSHLTPADRITVDIALSALEPPSPPSDEPRSGTRLESSGWVAELDEVTGDIARLVAPDGRMLEGVKGSLLAYRHESFDWAEFQIANLDLPPSTSKASDIPAVRMLIDTFMDPENADAVLVAVGPLTNVALAISCEPGLAKRIQKLVIMGGARVGGNVTPTAEFNFWVDPEAARAVFSSEVRKIVVMPLDATHRAPLTLLDCDVSTPWGHQRR